MTVGSVMTTRVVTVLMDDDLRTIREIFDNVRFHHLLVVNDEEELVGVISDRDLLKYLSPYLGTLAELPRDTSTMSKKAHQIMSRQPVTVSEAASVQSAVERMLEESVSCLPVVGSEGQVRGILSWKDLLRAVSTA